MDLTNLRDSLDSSSRERHPAVASAKKSELRLTKDFKAAALQLTTLYRTSLSSSTRSYAAGYTQSLTDILDVVLLRLQQPIHSAPGFRASAGTDCDTQGHGESDREELRWLSRYLRARIEAIKAEREEEDREESDEEEVQTEEPVRVATHRETNSSASSRRKTRQASPETSAAAANDIQISVDSHLYNDDTMTNTAEQDGLDDRQAKIASTSSFGVSAAHVPSAQVNATKARRQRSANGMSPLPGRTQSPSATLAMQPSSPAPLPASQPVNATLFTRASSTSSEEDASHISNSPRPTTPSRIRTNVRLGKRLSGRDKLSGLELFARAHQAKRRRGMGDRREDDPRDDGLL